MIALTYWQMAAVIASCTAFGFVFALVVLYHPGRPDPLGPLEQAPRSSRPPAPLPRAGYLPAGSTGRYEPRTDWPEPGWPGPGDTFSEISAGWDRLERNVAAQTEPFGKIRP